MCVFTKPISRNSMSAVDEKQEIKLLWPYELTLSKSHAREQVTANETYSVF